MTNSVKLKLVIGRLLDKINSDLDEGNAPSVEKLEALRAVTQLSSLNCQID